MVRARTEQPHSVRVRDESITEHTEEGARQESTAYDLDSRPSMADLRRAFADGWEQTLRSCVPAVVSIRVNLVASFDTERATSMQGGRRWQATGFVVDAARGLILTNRHVVTPGPIFAEAVFHNHEEVTVWPVYRDPVHDFGILRFDPSKVRFMKLVEIPLAPQRARIGVDVRVVGNDAGEKLSILTGTLARLDRAAPVYGVGRYNDFNTFYFQAASGTSGGSSGSPVLDIDGYAIAMNAGGKKKAASSFYIPLDRVERALKLIQQNLPVTRGTLQTVFKHQTYDETRRLGLRPEIEAHVRGTRPDVSGLLVVDQVIPEGPAHQKLEPGDVVTRIDGTLVTDFVTLEDMLDSHVDRTIRLTIERGGQPMEIPLTVQNLHDITPSSYVSISGAVLHPLSYQMAVGYSVPVGSVYVASSGYMFSMAGIQRNCVIVSVNNIRTPTIADFERVMCMQEDDARIPVRYYALTDVHRERIAIVRVDRHWAKFQRVTRNDETGLWDSVVLPPAPGFHVPKPTTTSLLALERPNVPSQELLPCFVGVEFNVPFSIDGVHGTSFFGIGLIVDAERGLVVVDANTVPIAVGDLSLTFASSVIIPGRIVYQHGLHNYTIIAYDPALIEATPVKAAKISDTPLVQGDDVFLVGLNKSHRLTYRQTVVTAVREMHLRECSPPRFRAVNVEVIEIDHPFSCNGGVLCNAQGEVQALWASYSFQDQDGNDSHCWAGMDMRLMLPAIEALRRDAPPRLRSMEVEFWPLQVSTARSACGSGAFRPSMGLSDHWIDELAKARPHLRTVMGVRRLTADTPAAGILKEGDLVLTAGGRVVVTFFDIFSCEVHADAVRLHILRDGVEMDVDVPTVLLPGHTTDRIVHWGGVILQEPHRAVAQQNRHLPKGVYSSWWSNGSPAHMYGLRATVWVTEVNGLPVPDLDTFLDVVKRVEKDDEYIRIKTVDQAMKTKVLTLKPNRHYCPCWELVRDASQPSGWRLQDHKPLAASAN